MIFFFAYVATTITPPPTYILVGKEFCSCTMAQVFLSSTRVDLPPTTAVVVKKKTRLSCSTLLGEWVKGGDAA